MARYTLNLPVQLKQDAETWAAQQGVSLNQFILWAVAEKVRGKRIPFEVMERAGVIGFALILIVFVIGLSNDISTLTGSGFNVR